MDSSFTDLQQSSALSLANSCAEEDLNKEAQASAVSMADSCQFPGSLSSLAADFNFSVTSAPTISVDPADQTLLPSMGYSPPGLSNQGLSPNLFSPVELAPSAGDKEDPGLQAGTSAASAGAGLGLSTVTASGKLQLVCC